MTAGYPRPPRALRVLLDALLVGWIVAWVLFAQQVGREVDGLAGLSDTVVVAGEALEETGQVVGGFASLPFVGGQVREFGEQIESAGRTAQRDARVSRAHVDELRELLVLAVAIVPSVPLALFWLPLRFGWWRETRGLRRALRRVPDDPGLERLLALRALQTLPVARLRSLSPDPWADLQAGRTRGLADAELRRLGVRRPSRRE